MQCRSYWRLMALLAAGFVAVGAAAQEPKPQPAAVEQVLQNGHHLGAESVGFSADGKWVVTGSYDGTVIVWDAKTGALLRRIDGREDGVREAVLSVDQKVIVTAGKTATLWDPVTGRRVRSLKGHEQGVNAVGISPDGAWVLTGADDKTAVLWDATTGEQVRTFKGHADHLMAVAFSPDGKTVATAGSSFDKTVMLWDRATGERRVKFEGHKASVRSVAFSPDGKLVVSGSNDRTALVWKAATGELVHTLPVGGIDYVTTVAFSPKGDRVAAGSDSGEAIVWTVADGKEVRSVFCKGGCRAVAFSPDGKQLLTGPSSGPAVLWEVETGKEIRSFGAEQDSAHLALFHPGGKAVAVPGKPGVFWDLAAGRPRPLLPEAKRWVSAAAFDADGGQLLTGDGDGKVVRWDVATGKPLMEYESPHKKSVSTVAFDAERKQFLTGGGGKYVLWDVGAAKPVREFNESSEFGDAAAMSPNGRWVVTASISPFHYWARETGKRISEYQVSGRADAMGFSADGARLWVATPPETVLYATSTGALLHRFKGDGWADVAAGAMSPDGTRLAGSATSSTVAVWDVEKKTRLHTLKGHEQLVRSVAYSPDGKWLLTGAQDGTARLWDAATGREVIKLLTFDDGKDWLVVTPEGLFDGSQGGRERVHFRVGKGLTVLPVDHFLPDYWMPGLLATVWAGERPVPQRDFPVAGPPEVRFLAPKGSARTDQESITVEVEATDEGGGIAGPFLTQNGARLRDVQAEEATPKGVRRTFKVRLVEGKNVLAVNAATKDMAVESTPASLTVVYDKPVVKSQLWVVAVGVSKYAQKDAELRFAAQDASSLLRLFTERGRPLYAAIHDTLLVDDKATAEGLRQALEAARKAHERDTFVLFLSGHGASVGGRYYFLPADFRSQPGQSQEDDVRKQGVAVDELAALLRQVPALKKVLILDTCNAGAALKILEKLRGKADPGQLKKEAERVYRGEGIYVIAAAADKQEAKEEKELGHGVLTYTLLAAFAAVEGGPLKGEPLRPGARDEAVDVLEWFGYAGKRMPDLMKKYFDRYQDPVVATERGGSFPILPAPKP
jgi:WD40 repeat protein